MYLGIFRKIKEIPEYIDKVAKKVKKIPFLVINKKLLRKKDWIR
jgi:hypothetical protein